jgi:hypothetical protein
MVGQTPIPYALEWTRKVKQLRCLIKHAGEPPVGSDIAKQKLNSQQWQKHE